MAPGHTPTAVLEKGGAGVCDSKSLHSGPRLPALKSLLPHSPALHELGQVALFASVSSSVNGVNNVIIVSLHTVGASITWRERALRVVPGTQ